MIMKTYRETYIRRAEIAQLIILHQLYMQKGSHNLIFQGGTALRWCYGGARFSEDLDFVTPLAPESIKKILTGALRGVEKVLIPHFGVGAFTLVEKKSRADALKCFVDFRPETSREKLSVKLEFEGLIEKILPQRENHVLSSLPTVAYLITAGDFRVPRPNTVIVTETPAEIISDKVRSLLERKYLKGRDLFDVWHLRNNLKTVVDVELVERKFSMYREVFVARRNIDFFASASKKGEKEMREAIEQDLSRFLPPEVLAVHQADGFAVFLQATRLLFAELKEKGMRLP
jgi:predicted nucleotidyltransferase component of viral defense system